MQAFKKTTNLTGLAVSKNPHKSLKALYNRILSVVKMMPSSSAYRIHTEKLVSQRLELVDKITDIPSLEKKIDCGQIEEVVIQAQNEYELAKDVLKWKPWEPLVQEPPATQWKWPI